MEEVAGRTVRYLYRRLVDEEGEPACVLVRFFKVRTFADLDPGLQEFARGLLGDRPEDPAMKCLTLLATAGVRPEWNDRTRSAGHRAIPLPSPEAVRRLPMITQLIRQLGFEVSSALNPDRRILMDMEQRTYNVFHVEEAEGSPYVPAQEDFVRPFGVRSVLGFGGMLPGGELYAVIMFSRVQVSPEVAALFRPLALSTKLALLPFQEVFAR